MLVSLSNREIAAVIWLGVLFAIGINQKTFREALTRIFELSFRTRLLPFFLFGIVNLLVLITALQRIGFWNVGQLKDILLWFVISGITMMFSGLKQENPIAMIKQTIADNFKILVLVEFFLSTYTLPLVGELIILPLLTLVAALVALSGAKVENAPATRALVAFQGSIGLAIIVWAIWSFLQNPSEALSKYTQLKEVG